MWKDSCVWFLFIYDTVSCKDSFFSQQVWKLSWQVCSKCRFVLKGKFHLSFAFLVMCIRNHNWFIKAFQVFLGCIKWLPPVTAGHSFKSSLTFHRIRKMELQNYLPLHVNSNDYYHCNSKGYIDNTLICNMKYINTNYL